MSLSCSLLVSNQSLDSSKESKQELPFSADYVENRPSALRTASPSAVWIQKVQSSANVSKGFRIGLIFRFGNFCRNDSSIIP